MSANASSFARRLAWSWTDTWLMTWRNLMYYVRNPYWLFYAVVQPIIFTLLFVYVFGGALGEKTPNSDYDDYLIPGVVVQTVIFSSLSSAINIADDIQKGVMDRFRSLPISRGTVTTARTVSDIVRTLLSAAIMVGVGFAVGYRFHGTWLAGLLALGLTVLVGFAFSWIAVWIGIQVKNTQTAEIAGFTWAFPLVFASSIFVPTGTMPRWLQAFVKVNPVSIASDAVRALSLGTPVGQNVLWTLVSCAAVIVVFRTLAVWSFRRMA
jgi:ABC-2 type transport system permease protein/oleandomycin transport system permease protein